MRGRTTVSLSILSCLFSSLPSIAQQPAQADRLETCVGNKAELLALDQTTFDQDPNRGWRPIARKPGCRLAAADLVHDYRVANEPDSPLLHWHEGQLRALEGHADEAARLFERSRRPASEDDIGWNHYVDATIAFLRKDMEELESARDALAGLPEPKDFSPVDRNGNPVTIAWPPNLDVVDALITCFGRSYEEAYVSCRRPGG